MIKKFLLLITLLTGMSTGLSANSLYLGYCNGEIATTGVGKTGDAHMAACLRIDAETLAPYIGAKLTAVRVGLVTADGVNDLTGWVRQFNDGKNLDEGPCASPVKGWNRIPLSGNLTVGKEPIYVGFDFVQHKSVKCISVVGKEREEGFILAKDDQWEIPRTPKGILSVELEITGDNLPGTDLSVAYVTPTPNLVQKGDKVSVEFGIQNIALNPVSNFSYDCSFNGKTVHSGTYNGSLGTGAFFKETFELDTKDVAGEENYPVTVSIKCDGDDNPENDSNRGMIAIYAQTFPRITLLEEFTTEMCPQCPRATEAVTNFMKSELAPKLAPVAHHAGFYTDAFTTADDKALLWLYGSNGTFAPASLLDRTAPAGAGTPVEVFGTYYDMIPKVTAATEVPAFVRIFINASYDPASRKLSVSTLSEKNLALDVLCPQPKINIWLTEDNLKPASAQGQAGNTDPNYVHRHVYRASLTGVWGTDMKWDGANSTSKTYQYTLPAAWKDSNVEIVAFVSEYDSVDRTKCKVYNARISSLQGTAINSLSAEPTQVVATELYDLMGRRVLNPEPGTMVIERLIFNNGSSKTSKKLISIN